MIIQFFNYLLLVIATALAMYVVVRAPRHRPARYFALFAAFLICLRTFSALRVTTYPVSTAPTVLLLVSISLGGVITALMLLLASMFVPQWWEGQRPIRWIVLPYVGTIAIIVVDKLLNLGLITSEIYTSGDTYRLAFTETGSLIIPGLLLVGSLFIIIFLIWAAIGNRKARRTILLMIGLITGAVIAGTIVSNLPQLSEYSGQFQTVLLLIAFAYVILRERAFEPRSQGVRLAMNAMRDAVIITDPTGTIVFVNGAASELEAHEGLLLADVLTTHGFREAVRQAMLAPLSDSSGVVVHLEADAQATIFDVTTQALLDANRNIQGLLVLLSDRTELAQRTRELTTEQQRLSEMVTQLQHEQAQRSELAATVRALSLPLIPVLDGVLVLPLIGTFDEQRMQEFKQVLLQGIDSANARHVLIDLTGVDLVDERHITGIMDGIRAARLLGAECTLVGIRPEIAQSLVTQSVDLQRLRSAATLREALSRHLRM